jgi:hypothetical protein
VSRSTPFGNAGRRTGPSAPPARYYGFRVIWRLATRPWAAQSRSSRALMHPIEIPVATLPIKLLMGGTCFLIALVVFWWGVPKFVQFLRVVLGCEPRKPGTKTIHLVAGFFVYAFIFFFPTVATLIFLELVTTPPSVVSSEGVTGGGGWVYSRKTFRWEDVNRINCIANRDGSVRTLVFVSGDRRIEIGNAGGFDLRTIREKVQEHVPDSVMRACHVPFSN